MDMAKMDFNEKESETKNQPEISFLDLPSDLKMLTKEQSDRLIKFYMGLTLKALRIRQDLNKQQMQLAYDQMTDAEKAGKCVTRLTRGADNLDIEFNYLCEAIYRKAFGLEGGFVR